MVRVTVRLDESAWKGLRRLAEEDRGTSGRASISGIAERLLVDGLARRGGHVAEKKARRT